MSNQNQFVVRNWVNDFAMVGGLEMRKVKCLIGIANFTIPSSFVCLLKLRYYQSYVPFGTEVFFILPVRTSSSV